MKTMYLLRGFDRINFKTFIPDPGLMETEGEAVAFCESNSNESTIYDYKLIRVGNYKEIANKRENPMAQNNDEGE